MIDTEKAQYVGRVLEEAKTAGESERKRKRGGEGVEEMTES